MRISFPVTDYRDVYNCLTGTTSVLSATSVASLIATDYADDSDLLCTIIICGSLRHLWLAISRVLSFAN